MYNGHCAKQKTDNNGSNERPRLTCQNQIAIKVLPDSKYLLLNDLFRTSKKEDKKWNGKKAELKKNKQQEKSGDQEKRGMGNLLQSRDLTGLY